MKPSESTTRPRLTDSGWYWLYLYCTFGLITLVAAGPKIAQMQLQAERNYQARERANQQATGQPISQPLATLETRRINLQPLFLILAGLLCLGWIILWYRHFAARQHEAVIPSQAGDP